MDIGTPFIVGVTYKRSTLHDQFGGSRYGGISPCSKFPYIFIFSGEVGKQHGYKDRWENENVFSYTGEGQLNDMEFIRGNLALRNHINNQKRVFLFVYTAKGVVRFEDEMVLDSLDYFIGPDRLGKKRTAIKFFFKRITYTGKYFLEETKNEIPDGETVYRVNIPNETERRGLINSRVGQGAYRKSVLYRWEFRCAVTNFSKPEVLIASHIVPWKESTNEERLDVDNSILLSPTYDALFDKHLISFENNGKIILSKSLQNSDYDQIGVTGLERIRKVPIGVSSYLERHRDKIL